MNLQSSGKLTILISIPLDQDLQTRLAQFIQSALNQSYSKDYSTNEVLELLDQAWEAQKLLWQLRAGS